MTETPGFGRDVTGRTTRRQFLIGAGGTVTGGLAGCTAPRSGDSMYDLEQSTFDPERLPYDRTYPDDDGITMFRGGLRRLGYYPDETVPDSVSINWQLPVNYAGHNAAKASPLPTPDGETVLIPSDTGRMHAVTPKGEHLWTTQTKATRQGFHATPVVVDGVAYIGGYDGANIGQEAAMYAFNVSTGDVLWRTEEMSGSVAIGSSAGYWDGYLFVIVEHRHPRKKGELWVFDAATGQPLLIDDRIDGMPHPTVAIDPVSERLLTGSNDGRVYCWEFPSLAFEWSFETGREVKGPIATYDGSAFVGSWDNHLYRLALEDGSEEWSFETKNAVMSAPAIDPEAGVVYFGSDDWHVYALDADTGEKLWSTNLQGRIMGAVTVTADAVLAGTTAAEMCALEKDTGELRWFVSHNGHVTSEPVPRDGRIYYAERAVVSGYFQEDVDVTTEIPGHAYCLVDAE
ncbi:MAG: PQQ-binding-like beta-propeller repeat protein [Halobacteriota archaeon]